MKYPIISIALSFLIFSAFSQSCLPEGIHFSSQAQIDNFQTNYPGCTEIEGMVTINGWNITNLNGLSVLTSIGSSLNIHGNSSLQNLTGLDNLTYARTILITGGNTSLHSLTGLEQLTSIGTVLWIVQVPLISDLNGLNNLSSIGSILVINGCDALTSLYGLEQLTQVAVIEIGNNSNGNANLTSIEALKNIDPGNIHILSIRNNLSLSACDIASTCAVLADPPFGLEVEIFGNAPGCISREEVEEACENFNIEESYLNYELSVHPNPASQKVTIYSERISLGEVLIYTLAGQQVLKTRQLSESIDISTLQPGMYIVEVTVESRKIRQKLLIQR